MLKKTNEILTGFRTVLLSVATWLLMYLETLFSNISGFTPEALKGAAVMAGVIIMKQLGTDVIPKLRGSLGK